jgi:hypothetical protein
LALYSALSAARSNLSGILVVPSSRQKAVVAPTLAEAQPLPADKSALAIAVAAKLVAMAEQVPVEGATE